MVFNFNKVVSIIVFGTVGIIHWTVAHFKLKSPKDFFFVIMICSNAISISYQPIHKITENIGYMTFGTLSICLVVFLYCFIVKEKLNLEKTLNIPRIPQEIRKSIIFGIFLSIALGVEYFLNLTNPY